MKKSIFIFDLDGVLTDTAHYHYLAWKQIADFVGIDFNQQDNQSLKGIDRTNSLKYILNKANVELTDKEFRALLSKKNDSYLELIENISPSDLYAGVLGLFSQLKRRDILIGLASASRNAYKVISRLRILEEFDYVADANLVSQNKPHPEIFLTVAKALNQLPQNCVGIEDAKAGIRAINSARMLSVGIGKKFELNYADIVYPTVEDFDLNYVLAYQKKSCGLAVN